MNTNKDSELLFASEDSIFRIVSIAKIVSWVLLIFYLISFVSSDLMPIFQKQANWPTQLSQWPIAIVSLLITPVMGLFYFLILQGVAHGLNLGLDIYYDFQPEGDEEEEVDEEVDEA